MLTRHFYTPMNLTVVEGLNQFCQFSIAEFFQLMAVMCLCTKFVNKNPFASLVAYISSIKTETFFRRLAIDKCKRIYSTCKPALGDAVICVLGASCLYYRAKRIKFLVVEVIFKHAC